ncbi:MAG: thioredoxin domain-containing protein [Candidatus Bilamarchaeum sp.]|jgi:glutaredoxin
MNEKHILYGLVGVLVIIAVVLWSGVLTPSKYDQFAQCLSNKSVTMYGAWWCPHCKNQKEAFGSSFKYINYVECSSKDGNTQLPVCDAAGISSYPTWKFANGSSFSAELSFEELSQKSGCPLPK